MPVAHLRYGYVRLQRDVIHRRRTERVVEDLIRFPKAPSDISLALFEQMDDVGSGQRSGRHVRPARYDASRAFMYEYGIRLQRLLRIKDGRQLFVFDIEQIQGLSSRVFVHRRNCRDGVAYEADLVQCHRSLVLDDETEVWIYTVADQIIST